MGDLPAGAIDDGQVRKGEQGFRVVGGFDARTKQEKERDREAEAKGERSGGIRRRFRVYTVFNAEQCDGIAPRKAEVPSWDPCDLADRILERSGVDIVHGPVAEAYYLRRQDRIHLPDPGLFDSKENYYHTLLHELVHATGHESRMERETLIKYGAGLEFRAREELYAEIGAMLVCTKLGLGYTPQHQNTPAYVEHWCDAIGSDPKVIREAAMVAGNISKHIIREIGGLRDKDLEWVGGEKQVEDVDRHKGIARVGQMGLPQMAQNIIQNVPSRGHMEMHR